MGLLSWLFGSNTHTEIHHISRSYVNEAEVNSWVRMSDQIQRQMNESERSRDAQIASLKASYDELMKNNAHERKKLQMEMEQRIGQIMADHQKKMNKEEEAMNKLRQEFEAFLVMKKEMHRQETEANLRKNQAEIELIRLQEQMRQRAAAQADEQLQMEQDAFERLQQLEAERVQELLNKQAENQRVIERMEQQHQESLRVSKANFQRQMEQVLQLQQQSQLEIEMQFAAQQMQMEELRRKSVVAVQQDVQAGEKKQGKSLQSLSKQSTMKRRFAQLGLSQEKSAEIYGLYTGSSERLQKAVQNLQKEVNSGEQPLNFQKHPGCSEVCPLIAFLQGEDGKTDSSAKVFKCEGHDVDYLFQMDFTDPSKMKVVSFAPHVHSG